MLVTSRDVFQACLPPRLTLMHPGTPFDTVVFRDFRHLSLDWRLDSIVWEVLIYLECFRIRRRRRTANRGGNGYGSNRRVCGSLLEPVPIDVEHIVMLLQDVDTVQASGRVPS